MKLIFRNEYLLALMVLANCASAQMGGGIGPTIPVNDDQAVQAIKAAGTQVSNQVQTHMKSESELIDAQTKELHRFSVQNNQIQMMQGTQENYDSRYGVKPRSSCAHYKGASSIMQGSQAVPKMRSVGDDITRVHLERQAYAATGEAYGPTNGMRILDQMDKVRKFEEQRSKEIKAQDGTGNKKGVLELTGIETLSTKTDANGVSEYIVNQTRNDNIINPFPTEVRADFNRTAQPAATAAYNAAALIQIERYRKASEPFNRHAANRADIFDKEFAKSLFIVGSDSSTAVPSASAVAALGTDTKVGWYGVLSILNRHRIMDKDWVLNTATGANPIGLQRDNNLMMAQNSATLQEILVEETNQTELLGLIYAILAEKSGPPVPNH